MIIGTQSFQPPSAGRTVSTACNGGCSHSRDSAQLGDPTSLPDVCPKSLAKGITRPCPLKVALQARVASETVAQQLTGIPVSPVLSKPDPATTLKLKELLPDKPFVIEAGRAAELAKTLGISGEQLMLELIPVAKEMARPPVSEYLVGAVGRGESGNLYLGVNLEFGKQALNQTTHGEQFVVQNAMHAGEARLTSLAVSAEPCGHCRQFLNELTGAKELEILIPEKPKVQLKELLPRDFGPQDLGVKAAVLSPQAHSLSLPEADELTGQALQAANKSYSPYSQSPSGVAIQLKDGSVFTGSYIENAAFNPSLSPLQAALMNVVAAKRSYEEIDRVVLVERQDGKASQDFATSAVLASIAPSAEYTVRQAKGE
jgi:cytidine deaminase